MHPYARHMRLHAVADDLLGRLRPRNHHDAVNAAGYRLQVRVASVALERFHVRVDGEHVVARRLQPVVNQVADWMVALVAGYARDGDALLDRKSTRLNSSHEWISR